MEVKHKAIKRASTKNVVSSTNQTPIFTTVRGWSAKHLVCGADNKGGSEVLKVQIYFSSRSLDRIEDTQNSNRLSQICFHRLQPEVGDGMRLAVAIA